MNDLVIFGTGRYAELAHYYFTRDDGRRVVAFTVDAAYVREPTFQGVPVVAFEDIEAAGYGPDRCEMFVAMGIQEVNQQRARKVREAEARGFRLASHLSPRAWVAPDLVLAPNSMVMEYAALHPFVEIGRNCVVWSNTRIGFHTRVLDHCWIVAPVIGESTTIGEYTFVGINATIGPFANIGRSNVIGAGAVVLGDTRDRAVYRAAVSKPSRVPSDRLRRI